VHSACTLFVPGLTCQDAILLGPVEGVPEIPKARWKLKCAVCKVHATCNTAKP
jgi:hypothetical protein